MPWEMSTKKARPERQQAISRICLFFSGYKQKEEGERQEEKGEEEEEVKG